jgi:Protein of unknown function, DUF488
MKGLKVEKQMLNDAAASRGSSDAEAMELFTVGHSNHELPFFLDLLRQARINAIADVRSQPFSQRYFQFNRAELARELEDQGIVYAFLGNLLGGRPQQPSLYDADGRVNYERVRKTTAFGQGLDQLCQVRQEFTVAMLCAEEDPLDCHRGLMITPALVEQDIFPVHLRGDGSRETTAAMEKRLLAESKLDDGSMDGLFAAALTPDDRRHMLAEAYRSMARRKAFRLRSGESEE